VIRTSIRQVFLVGSLLVMAASAQGFVGQIAVGLGEVEERGRIDVSFSGTATFETEEMTTDATVYYEPGKVRDEINMQGQDMVVIRRFDLNKFWMLIGHGMYMEVSPDETEEKTRDYTLVSREKIGRETVNGMETTKYKSIYETSDGKFGGFTWFTDDNIAVKAFMVHESKGEKQRMKFEFKSLQRGSQDDALFELPAGAKPFSMGNMMSGFGQMSGQNTPASAGQPPAQEDASAAEGEDRDLAGEVVDEAQDSAMDATIRGVSDSVSKGIGKLFGK
jgi:hypothetical protein